MAETEIHRALGRIEGKLDAMHGRLDSHSKKQDDLDQRVDAVEKRQAYWAGGVAVIASVMTTGLMTFWKNITQG